MSVLAPEAPAGRTLEVRPWPDAVIDTVGHDPRSEYVEQFWLAVLGPCRTWLLRRLATGFERRPSASARPRDDGPVVGLGMRSGRHSTFLRTVKRYWRSVTRLGEAGNVLMMRRKLPPLTVTRWTGSRTTSRKPTRRRSERSGHRRPDAGPPARPDAGRRSRPAAHGLIPARSFVRC